MSNEKIMIKVDPDLVDLIPGFIEKRNSEIPIMWDSLKKKDFATLQSLGHKLKGNAGGYGFDQMGEMGAAMENGAKANDAAAIEIAIKGIENYLSRLEIIYE